MEIEVRKDRSIPEEVKQQGIALRREEYLKRLQ